MSVVIGYSILVIHARGGVGVVSRRRCTVPKSTHGCLGASNAGMPGADSDGQAVFLVSQEILMLESLDKLFPARPRANRSL